MTRFRYRLRYWMGKAAKLLGICRDCRSRLNFLPSGYGLCPNCRKKF